MTEPQGDLDPDDTADTTTVSVVLVQLGLVEILGQVDEQPGDVADDVQDDDSSQSPGRVGEISRVLSLEGEIDGGVGDEKEEYGQQSRPQGSGPVDVVVDVVWVQPQGGRLQLPHLPGDVVGVRHVDVEQL